VVRFERPELLSGWFGPRTERPELQELIAALANEPTRPVEGRLTGGFKYAPPPSPTRGPGDREVSPDVRIAAANIEKLTSKRADAVSEHVLGLAFAATGQLDAATLAFERAASQRPEDASFQADLSALYLSLGIRQNRSDDLSRAEAAAELALRLDSTVVAASFNRAIALEQQGDLERALNAWRDYLNRDRTSAWADEARTHVSKIEQNLGRK